MRVSDETVRRWLKEDLPYFDLTTHLLNMEEEIARVEFHTRESGILAGSEEVGQICRFENLKVIKFQKSGSKITAGDIFFIIEGDYSSLNKIAKVAQNIFEYASAIATKTDNFVKLAKSVNEQVNILTTRKVFPGTKELAIKASLAGGAYPHRLGLSETILLFKQHLDFIGIDRLPEKLTEIRNKDCEKPIVIEAESISEVEIYSKLDIDGIQYDKFSIEQLGAAIKIANKNNSKLFHLATGGVNEENIKGYARLPINGIVTTSLYTAKPFDIGARFLKA